MSTFYTTFTRRLEMLNFLRSQTIEVSTDRIAQHLLNGGYLDESLKLKSQLRVVQRDLRELLGEMDDDGEFTNEFGLVMTRGLGKSLWWRLDPYNQRLFDFEKMPAFMALAFSVTQKHLSQVLPSNTQTELNRLFQEAESKLHKQDEGTKKIHYRKLKNAVEFFQRGQSLQPPNFDMLNLDTLYRAILLGHRVAFKYRTASGWKDYDVHPFGVAIMLPKIYLVAVKNQDMRVDRLASSSFRSFLVHKMDAAYVLPQSNAVPDSFNMKQYLHQGHMDVLIDASDSGIYQLELEIDVANKASNLISDLEESPVAPDQSLEKVAPERYRLRASVRRTVQLKNWLLALGADSVVLAPDIISEDMQRALSSMLDRYR